MAGVYEYVKYDADLKKEISFPPMFVVVLSIRKLINVSAFNITTIRCKTVWERGVSIGCRFTFILLRMNKQQKLINLLGPSIYGFSLFALWL